jgi:phytoene dehydrogenase-like protein
VSAEPFDAIVIGAGHNGLVAAAYLARAGRRTLVLERQKRLGGAAGSEEILPGHRVDLGASDIGFFRPEIAGELNLAAHGLRFLEAPALVHSLLPEGGSLTLWRDTVRAQREIARFSPVDARRYPEFLAFMRRMSGQLEAMAGLTPPSLFGGMSLAEKGSWARWALRLRGLGRGALYEFLRLIPMSAMEFMQEWFASEPLRGALGSLGVTGQFQGPMASGTALMMLYAGHPERGMRAARYVEGGSGRLIEALASAARGAGAEIRAGAEVRRIRVDGTGQQGVELSNGQHLAADIVLSSAHPRVTLLELVDPQNLEVRTTRSLRSIRSRGSIARVHLSLSALPEFGGRPDPQSLCGHILLCPSLEYLERAFDHAKFGRFSPSPYLDVSIPTLLDPTLAPAGRHLLSASVQYAPYELSGSSWGEQCEALGDAVVTALAEHAPGLPGLILQRQVITPLDLEQQYGLPQGDIFHGQMALDQLLFMRPIPGYGQYRSPIQGLYLCGAGAHPGGGLSGLPGRNAARQALRDH